MAAIIQNIHEVMFMYCCAKNRSPFAIYILLGFLGSSLLTANHFSTEILNF